MNQISKTPYLLLLALIFSCSSDDESSLEPKIEPIEVSLYSSKISYNVFEPITYKLNYKDTYSAFDLLQCYDSIIWEIPETSRANITEMNDYTRGDYTSITVQWIHHFSPLRSLNLIYFVIKVARLYVRVQIQLKLKMKMIF